MDTRVGGAGPLAGLAGKLSAQQGANTAQQARPAPAPQRPGLLPELLDAGTEDAERMMTVAHRLMRLRSGTVGAGPAIDVDMFGTNMGPQGEPNEITPLIAVLQRQVVGRRSIMDVIERELGALEELRERGPQ